MNKSQYLPPNIYVRYHYPEEWQNCWRQLHPIFKLTKSKEQHKGKCSLWKDSIVINEKEFTTALMNKLIVLLQDFQPRNTAEKQNDSVLCFLGSHSVFSNLHKTKFQFDDSSMEQHIQCSKAQLCDDDFAHHRIINETGPYKIKQIGSRIKSYQKKKWQSVAKQIAIKANTAGLSSK